MGTGKMSGEVSRSRQKKAAAPAAKKAQNGQNGGSTGSNWNKENKKKSKDRKNQKKLMAAQQKTSQPGFFNTTTVLVILLTLTGLSVASYHQYPEQVQAVFDVLPPQAIVMFDTVKDTTVHYGKLATSKSADFILDGIDLASAGYGQVHPYVQKAVDGTKDTLGPYIGPYVGPYWDAFYNHLVTSYGESQKLAREWSREINIGEFNLEKFLYADEIEKESLEKARLAAEKIKAAVEEMNKKKEAEEEARIEAELKAKKEAEEKAKKEAEEKAR